MPFLLRSVLGPALVLSFVAATLWSLLHALPAGTRPPADACSSGHIPRILHQSWKTHSLPEVIRLLPRRLRQGSGGRSF
jgi:hypothetical protein